MQRRLFEARDVGGEADTDARPTSGHPARPEIVSDIPSSGLRRRALALGLWTVFLSGCLAAALGENGLADLWRISSSIDAERSEVERRRAEIVRLEHEVARLRSDPAARERVAREELGLVRPGEIDFLLPRETPPLGAPR